jgi:hypothetical protein
MKRLVFLGGHAFQDHARVFPAGAAEGCGNRPPTLFTSFRVRISRPVGRASINCQVVTCHIRRFWSLGVSHCSFSFSYIYIVVVCTAGASRNRSICIMLHVVTWFPYILSILLIAHFLSNYWRLRHIPGPWYASCTNLYRLFVVWGRDSHDVYLKLHRKYGDVVRIGPNCVSISGPGIKENIYGIQKGFVKVLLPRRRR